MPATRTADLCEEHFGLLKELKRSKRKKKLKLVTNRSKINFDTVNPRILELADAQPFFTAVDVSRVLKLSKHTADAAVNGLIHAGKLDSTGTGRARKLSKAS